MSCFFHRLPPQRSEVCILFEKILQMANRDANRRQPEFTNTQYEIPSWQTPWNVPWYQRENSNNDVQKRFKYNDRGHLNDCTCANCEDDLEKAFAPHTNTTEKTVSDIPKDRHGEVKIQDHLKDLHITCDRKGSASSSSNAQNVTPKKVFLFSDLEEVTPKTVSNSLATITSSTTSNPNATTANSRESFSHTYTSTSNTSESNPVTHDSMMDMFDSITAIQAISDQTKDIQTRVHSFNGSSSSQEYKTMRDLLLALKRELTRIHSNVEWFAVSKGMALDAITKTLQILDQRANADLT